jgi:hypothetical protein
MPAPRVENSVPWWACTPHPRLVGLPEADDISSHRCPNHMDKAQKEAICSATNCSRRANPGATRHRFCRFSGQCGCCSASSMCSDQFQAHFRPISGIRAQPATLGLFFAGGLGYSDGLTRWRRVAGLHLLDYNVWDLPHTAAIYARALGRVKQTAESPLEG